MIYESYVIISIQRIDRNLHSKQQQFENVYETGNRSGKWQVQRKKEENFNCERIPYAKKINCISLFCFSCNLCANHWIPMLKIDKFYS